MSGLSDWKSELVAFLEKSDDIGKEFIPMNFHTKGDSRVAMFVERVATRESPLLFYRVGTFGKNRIMIAFRSNQLCDRTPEIFSGF